MINKLKLYVSENLTTIYRNDGVSSCVEREIIDGSTQLAKDCQPVKFLFAYFEKIDLWGNVT